MEVVELKVRLHCKACQKSVREALYKLKGVTCVEMDVISSKITVFGYIDRKVIIKAIRKTGRRAEAWASSCQDSGSFVSFNSGKPSSSKGKSGKLKTWVRDLKSLGRSTFLNGEGTIPLVVVSNSAEVGAIGDMVYVTG